MNVKVEISFIIKDLISKEDLKLHYDNDLFSCVEDTINNEGIASVIDNDSIRIKEVKEWR